jgi:hypothetical protein
MKYIILLSCLVIASVALQAQNAVVLQHAGSAKPFTTNQPFVDAYNAALDGDTIYLPGGLIYPPTNINKRLVIVGAGHYPDSSAATGPTIISQALIFEENADRAELHGVKVFGDIWFAESKRIDSVSITRCYANRIIVAGFYDTLTNSRELYFFGNATGELNLSHSIGARAFNNIINVISYASRNAWIRNNKINTAWEVRYALFENNTLQYLSGNVDLNTFRNNTLSFTPGQDFNVWVNNYINVDWNSLFVNQTEWFNYTDNYHLKTPAAYLGTDGLQVGIYGGFRPYKESAIPFNPHIQSKTIPLQADVNGLLNIQVKIAAQNY